MSMLRTSTRFCLLCYKSTDSSVQTEVPSDSIKIFTKVLNRLTKTYDTDKCLYENKLLDKINDLDRLLVFCTKCQQTILEICKTFHTIKTLELKLDWKLDKLKDKISYANKVPSRWVNVSKTFDELCQNDTSKKLDTQNSIREFRKNVVNAGSSE